MNFMLQEIESLPELMGQIFDPLDDMLRHKLDRELCLSLQRIFVTGCGDSHHASLSTEFAMESLTGVPVEPMNAFQFARYAAGFIPRSGPKTNLVVGISVSGAVSHTVEAVRMGGQAGAITAGLTANPQGDLARNSGIVLEVPAFPLPIPEGVVIPGVRSYFTNQISLLLIAVRIAEVRGALTDAQAKEVCSEIRSLSEAIAETVQACAAPAKQIVEDTMGAREFVFAGSGPNFGTALFSAAKILEASGDSAVGQDVEEWAHLQYFAREAATPTFIITAGDRDLSRAEEVAVAAKAIKRRLFVTAPVSCKKLIQTADGHLPIPSVRELFSPIVTAIPGELIAAFRAEAMGETYFRGFSGGRSIEGGGGISRIRTSETWSEWKP